MPTSLAVIDNKNQKCYEPRDLIPTNFGVHSIFSDLIF